MKTKLFVSTCLLALAASSCGGAEIPDENYAPEQTIAAAEERSAEDHPEAQLHMQLARDQMNEANKLKEDGKDKDANLLMMRAQADADYALALLRRADQQASTAEIREKLSALREEMRTATTEE